MKNNEFLLSMFLIAPMGIMEASLLTRENLADFIAHDNGIDTLQLKVPCQFRMKNGAASCGYQALFNGRSIRALLTQDEGTRSNSLRELRSNKKSREELFSSKESPWRSHVISRDNRDGDWIDSVELEKVLSKIDVDLTSTFITGNNVLQPDIPLSEDPLLSTSPDFEEFVKQFRSNEGSVTATFLVYLKSLQAKSTKISPTDTNVGVLKNTMSTFNHGHWICMVAHRVGAERQFIIADSSANESRIEHYRIKELRALLLEGPAYATDADGRFIQWIADARPAVPSLNSLFAEFKNSSPYKFTQEHPFSTGILVSFAVCCIAKYMIDSYSRRSDTTYRSPEGFPSQDSLPIAVH